MNNKQKHLAVMVAGFLLVIFGLIYNLTNLAGTLISLIFINMGIILLVVGTLKYNQLGAGVKQDERTRMISSKALSYSWLIVFVAINILFWIDYFKLIEMSISQVLGMLMFLAIISTVVLKYIFNRGEV